jgi:hypothetical protein
VHHCVTLLRAVMPGVPSIHPTSFSITVRRFRFKVRALIAAIPSAITAKMAYTTNVISAFRRIIFCAFHAKTVCY